MDSRKIVFRETAIVAVGEVLLSAVMVAVFAALGYFQMNVLWGALAGALVTTANYFSLALVVCLASDRATAGDPAQGQSFVFSGHRCIGGHRPCTGTGLQKADCRCHLHRG